MNAATNSRAEQNRLNSLHSTGPRTESGKSVSKLNAVKSGLTGRTVVLPSEDAARYEAHVQSWIADLQPEGARESALVQSIADAHWRTERIVSIEFSLYAQGRMLLAPQIAEQFPNADAPLQAQLLEGQIHLSYEKHFRNLSIQESRIRRERDKDMKELERLQAERREEEKSAKTAQDKKGSAVVPMAPKTSGFVFSTAQTAAPNQPSIAGPLTIITAPTLPTGGDRV